MNHVTNRGKNCPKCGGNIVVTTKASISYVDLIGVLVVGSFVFCILGVLVFMLVESSHMVRALGAILWLGGVIAFGLYHMVGYSKKTTRYCDNCSETFSEKESA